jgi:hypothetical protein
VTFEESVRPGRFESYPHVGGWFRGWGEGRNGGRGQRGSRANLNNLNAKDNSALCRG